MDNFIIKFLYKAKFYFNISMSQIGFLTNKLPELMGALWLLEKMGFIIPGRFIGPMMITLLLLMVGIGWFWRLSGLYHAERYIQANYDPVQEEILSAAKLINKHFKEEKR